MSELSEAQRRVLEALADGKTLLRAPKCYFVWPGARPVFTHRTVDSVWRRGFVEEFREPGKVEQWRITDAGRAALAQREGRSC